MAAVEKVALNCAGVEVRADIYLNKAKLKTNNEKADLFTINSPLVHLNIRLLAFKFLSFRLFNGV
ncbi:MAG: hypothetical protein EBS27_01035 [Actinobacteria bacterium]|nr:hypothetical protein [Actinomycetota bacterium]